MERLKVYTDPGFEEDFNAYPEAVREKLLILRDLIIETAREIEGVDELNETLKWGEPSFLAKKGSTIRIDWKETKSGLPSLGL
jgi:hypothetical protein